LRWPSLSGARVAWLLFGENKIFYHLGETGRELELTNFHEKSGEP
jgi:hypothetical protein